MFLLHFICKNCTFVCFIIPFFFGNFTCILLILNFRCSTHNYMGCSQDSITASCIAFHYYNDLFLKRLNYRKYYRIKIHYKMIINFHFCYFIEQYFQQIHLTLLTIFVTLLFSGKKLCDHHFSYAPHPHPHLEENDSSLYCCMCETIDLMMFQLIFFASISSLNLNHTPYTKTNKYKV